MRIAVPYEDGQVFQHFGHAPRFKLYDAEDGKIVATSILERGEGCGCGAIAGFLKENKVEVVICGGIGGGAMNNLKNAGLRLFGGVTGEADRAAEALLAGDLEFDPFAHCASEGSDDRHCGHGHGEGHSCGGHCH